MLKKIYAVTAVTLIAVILAGCPSQTTIAALTLTLGNTAAAVATIEGNPTLAAKLTTDTQAAVKAINAWKPGTPAQDALQAINIVVADLNLFPVTGQYAALIQLALATAASIIQILSPGTTTAHAHTATPVPATAKDFHKACLQIAANDNFNAAVCK